ncbi:MAG TPA: sialidase family protein, partial [Spirillospora sp.]|nr:sialidase family protein [Spirillospora sp.]
NPTASGRTPLRVAWSTEDETWPHGRTLEDGPGEFSYPTLLQSADGDVHLVYTYRREHIQYACFDEAWVRGAANG